MTAEFDISDSDRALMDSLRAGLDSGALLRDGRVMAERDLAQQMAISRARLRRALDRMEQDGVIFRRQGQGTFVLPPPLPHAPRVRSLAASVTPHHVMEVRLEIEPALAALAAERATPDAIRQLQGVCDETSTFVSLESYDRADDIFHYKIAQMAENPLFMAIFEEIRAVRRDAAWMRRVKDRYPAHKVTETSTQHAAIFAAIAGQDPQAAAFAMRRHLICVSTSRQLPLWSGHNPAPAGLPLREGSEEPGTD